MMDVAVDTTRMPWEPADGYPDGTQWKILNRDENGNPTSLLLKLPAGFEMQDHTHVMAEQHFVVEGEYESRGNLYSQGFYQLIPGHTGHGPYRSQNGATLLVFWQK